MPWVISRTVHHDFGLQLSLVECVKSCEYGTGTAAPVNMLASCLPVRVWPRFGHLLVWSTFETFMGTFWSLSVGVVLASLLGSLVGVVLAFCWAPVGKKRKDGGVAGGVSGGGLGRGATGFEPQAAREQI